MEEKPTEKPQVISLVPLEAKRPPQTHWGVLIVLTLIAGGVAGGAWIVYDLSRGHFHDKSPAHEFSYSEPSRAAEKQASLERMNKLAEALVNYKNQFGGGLRWPGGFGELQETGLLPEDFDFRGPLSERPIVYLPHIPAQQDPALWVLAHDRLYGRRAGRRGMNSQGVIGAVVMFADGNVRFLDEKEVVQYGGLNDAAMAR